MLEATSLTSNRLDLPSASTGSGLGQDGPFLGTLSSHRGRDMNPAVRYEEHKHFMPKVVGSDDEDDEEWDDEDDEEWDDEDDEGEGHRLC